MIFKLGQQMWTILSRAFLATFLSRKLWTARRDAGKKTLPSTQPNDDTFPILNYSNLETEGERPDIVRNACVVDDPTHDSFDDFYAFMSTEGDHEESITDYSQTDGPLSEEQWTQHVAAAYDTEVGRKSEPFLQSSIDTWLATTVYRSLLDCGAACQVRAPSFITLGEMMHGSPFQTFIYRTDPPEQSHRWLLPGPEGRDRRSKLVRLLVRWGVYGHMDPKVSVWLVNTAWDCNDLPQGERPSWTTSLAESVLAADHGAVRSALMTELTRTYTEDHSLFEAPGTSYVAAPSCEATTDWSPGHSGGSGTPPSDHTRTAVPAGSARTSMWPRFSARSDGERRKWTDPAEHDDCQFDVAREHQLTQYAMTADRTVQRRSVALDDAAFLYNWEEDDTLWAEQNRKRRSLNTEVRCSEAEAHPLDRRRMRAAARRHSRARLVLIAVILALTLGCMLTVPTQAFLPALLVVSATALYFLSEFRPTRQDPHLRLLAMRIGAHGQKGRPWKAQHFNESRLFHRLRRSKERIMVRISSPRDQRGSERTEWQ